MSDWELECLGDLKSIEEMPKVKETSTDIIDDHI